MHCRERIERRPVTGPMGEAVARGGLNTPSQKFVDFYICSITCLERPETTNHAASSGTGGGRSSVFNTEKPLLAASQFRISL